MSEVEGGTETGAAGGTEVTERERNSSFHGFRHTKVSFSFLTREDRRGVLQTQTSLEVTPGR